MDLMIHKPPQPIHKISQFIQEKYFSLASQPKEYLTIVSSTTNRAKRVCQKIQVIPMGGGTNLRENLKWDITNTGKVIHFSTLLSSYMLCNGWFQSKIVPNQLNAQ